MTAQLLPALDKDAEGAYLRLESDIVGLCIGRPAAAPGVQTVLHRFERALALGSSSRAGSAWAEFVAAADDLRTLVAHAVPAYARSARTRRGLRVLDTIVRENGDLRAQHAL